MAHFLLAVSLLVSTHAEASLRKSCQQMFQYFATREPKNARMPFIRQFMLQREPSAFWGRWLEPSLPHLEEGIPSITVQGADWTVVIDQVHEKVTFHVKCSPKQRNHILRSLALSFIDQTRKNLGKPVPRPLIHVYDDGLQINNIFLNEYGQQFLAVFEKLIDTPNPYQTNEFNFATRAGVIELDLVEGWIESNIIPDGLARPTIGDILSNSEEVPGV